VGKGPAPPAPVITLTTDFGLRDPFVGIMKGVILGICPLARLVDLTHELPPQDVQAGQLALAAAAGFFPPGTIHLAVVDPGVGSARRPLALAAGERYFVGPDNGLFTFALDHAGWRAVALDSEEHRLPDVSRTFHGRDIFAPAAGHLASGVPLERLGLEVPDPVRLPLPAARRGPDGVLGEVLDIDHFGNLVTSVTAEDLRSLEARGGVAVEVAGRCLRGAVAAYAAVEPGQAGALIGSVGRLEIFVRGGSAAAVLGASRGVPVRVRPA
jgi:S-adenosyl-L-methionine hydrolase (adenosine-forming)